MIPTCIQLIEKCSTPQKNLIILPISCTFVVDYIGKLNALQQTVFILYIMLAEYFASRSQLKKYNLGQPDTTSNWTEYRSI